MTHPHTHCGCPPLSALACPALSCALVPSPPGPRSRRCLTAGAVALPAEVPLTTSRITTRRPSPPPAAAPGSPAPGMRMRDGRVFVLAPCPGWSRRRLLCSSTCEPRQQAEPCDTAGGGGSLRYCGIAAHQRHARPPVHPLRPYTLPQAARVTRTQAVPHRPPGAWAPPPPARCPPRSPHSVLLRLSCPEKAPLVSREQGQQWRRDNYTPHIMAENANCLWSASVSIYLAFSSD